ncbi:hypothetical protein EZS27_005214 [termite gut metagenome]|uniref:GLUG domain-containing protein n=1 Tax=termite gut metagenome TaxID=433724 RepID=A0A5J4SMX8_9ZZZZ
MKKAILYPHLFACLSLLFFLTGCEREEIVSERIALNALEVQLNATRVSDADDPTLTTPNNRRNWVLEVQIEGSHTEDYVFSEQDEVWIPQSNPAYFPTSVNNGECNVTFTLRPPTSLNATIGQDGSATGLLEADTLKNTFRMKPQKNVYFVPLVHTNSLIEIAFEYSLENRVIEIELQGNKIHPYSTDNKNYLCIVPSGSSNIAFTTKAKGTEQYASLDVDSGTKPNTRYVFTFFSDSGIIHSPIMNPWSTTTGVDAIFEAKEFIHIEGYADVISFMASGTLVRIYPHPDSKEGKSIYYFPSTSENDILVDSIQLEKYSKSILIGRHSGEQNIVKLKVDSVGRLLFRESGGGIIPINIIGEIQLINTEPKLHYKQEADIDFSCLSEKQWTPIGSFESPFKGVYDGNGYRINHLDLDIKTILEQNPDHLEDSGYNYNDATFIKAYYWALPIKTVGLFGVNNGIINNVHIASGMISLSKIIREDKTTVAFGAICGYNDGGSITNCVNNALMSLHEINDFEIPGPEIPEPEIPEPEIPEPEIPDSEIPDSEIPSPEIPEPVVAWSNVDYFTVGGICGTNRGDIKNCINYGSIIAEKGVFANLLIGGICGMLYSRYETDKTQINSCINHGDVFFSDIFSAFGTTRSFKYGGISAMMYYYHSRRDDFSDNIQKIVNCYNVGNAIEKGTLGTKGALAGIVGMMFYPFSTYSGKISSCYYNGNIKMEVIQEGAWLDPLIALIIELKDPANPYYSSIEKCFYSAAAWGEKIRFYEGGYFPQWKERYFNSDEGLEYINMANNEILETTPAFSQDFWPNGKLWDTNVWRDLGSWNGGNPIYPKLGFEKD